MLSVRNAVLTAIAISALSLVVGIFTMMRAPDSGGAAVDSYGTRRDGFRAVFELLSAFDVPVERRIEPPSADWGVASTYVLWSPHADLVANEPAYLEKLLPWVDRGGRLVLAVPPEGRMFDLMGVSRLSNSDGTDIWSVLEIDGIQPIQIELDDAKSGSTSPRDTNAHSHRHERIRQSIENTLGLRPVEFTAVDAVISGSFESTHERVRTLQIPKKQIGGLELSNRVKLAGKVECERPGGKAWVIAASFPRGKGQIVVVAEPMLMMNASLSHEDNSALIYDILASDGRKVIFDEFYHGLSVRGNPLWLLTKSTYSTVAFAIMTLLGLFLWRSAISLGPPLEDVMATRRTITEYIEAMARFLNRGRKSRPFLLNEVRAGTLRSLGEQWGLSPAVHDPEVIAATISKRSPIEAEQFRQAMRALDAAVAKGTSLSESEAIRVLQRVSSCL